MSVFNVLPSGVNTFFPTFWKHPDALFKKKKACGWRRIHCRTVWMTASRPLKFTTDSINSMGKSVSRTRVFERCKCFREGRERVENEPHDRQPRTSVTETVREWIRRQPQAFIEKGIRMLPERWKKCVDSGGEYVED